MNPTEGTPPGASPETSAVAEPRVEAAVARLAELDGLAVPEHVALFEDVHRRLQDTLADIDGV